MSTFNQYQEFIQALFATGDTLSFMFNGEINGKKETVHEFIPATRALTPGYYQKLQSLNAAFDIYVAMNPYKPELVGQGTGRTKSNVAEIKRLYADADSNGETVRQKILSSTKTPPPSVVLESSPNKFQFTWNVRGLTQETAEPLLKAIAAEYGTDPAVAEVARVLRVPGLRNLKYADAPEVKVVGDIDGSVYDCIDFKVAVQPMPEKNESPRDENNLIPKGYRYHAIISHAGKLRDLGYDIEGVVEGTLRWAHTNIAPPFKDDDVRQYAREIATKFPQGLPNGGEVLMSGSIANQAAPQPGDVSNWRSMFRSVEEMEDGPIVIVIDGVLQEGTCFIGANPGDGKTLIALAFAKAISTGTPLFGLPMYPVPEPRTVIYLIPESRDRAFRRRCEAFQMPRDKMKFMARTISAGVSLELGDPYLLEAVRQTKAVVFLDTASRFMKGMDENAAAQNRQLVNDVISLLAAGATCVVLIHHATKAAKQKQERMSLENMLRGTSDFGAMCDQAYGIRKDMTLYANGSGPMEIDLVSLKDREQIGGLSNIRLGASHKNKGESFPVSYINEIGNFKVIHETEASRRDVEALVALVSGDPEIPAKELAKKTGLSDYGVKQKLGSLGWHRVQGGSGGASPWHRDDGGPCPFARSKPTKAVN